MSKEILSTNGEKLGEITLNEAVFGVEPNLHVMHLALRRQLNNARQGSASAKTRAEVSGGGKKPWKQKGTGRCYTDIRVHYNSYRSETYLKSDVMNILQKKSAIINTKTWRQNRIYILK